MDPTIWRTILGSPMFGNSRLGIKKPWPYNPNILPVVSIVAPFWVYRIRSLLYIWLNQKKELQWRL